MSVFSATSFDSHEQVFFTHDKATGLRAIVAVHDTTLGPAVGGCRMFPYNSDAEALEDVLRLSRGMTYKSALAGLPFGGGKSVIIGNPAHDKTPALLAAMGDFIESLGGQYIAAEDSGMGVADIHTMRERTQWVSGIAENEHGGDPSPSTAYGVFLGIRTAVGHRLRGDSMAGIKVAVQGLGNVGYHLARFLVADGATVYGADVNEYNVARAVQELGISPAPCDDVLSLPVDVLAPCAMGAILDGNSIPTIRAGIICGAANNQLATTQDGVELLSRGVLYCPDFVVNAGGIIDVHHQHLGSSDTAKRKHILGIGDTLAAILLQADSTQRQTHTLAEEMAESIIRQSVTSSDTLREAI